MAQLRFVGPFNGRLPEATGQAVWHARKPDEFPLNRYVKYIPTESDLAYYVQLGFDAPVRVYSDEQMAWEDGAKRDQMGEDNGVEYQMIPFRTFRRNRAWTLGYKAIDQTKAFKLKPAHIDTATSQILTNRVNRYSKFITNTANWGGNTATANTLNGGRGTWDTASDNPADPGYNAIFATLQNVAQRLHLATNGMIKPGGLKFVMSPGSAIKMSMTSEIVNYCRESPYSKAILEQGLDPQYQRWGLPERFKGYEFVVEDAMIVTQQANVNDAAGSEATTNRTYCFPDGKIVACARPGTLDGTYGTKEYSTLQLYHYGPLLEVEGYDDPENRRVRGHVSEDTKEVVISATGYLITSVFS